MIISTILISIIGTIVTERIIIKKLGKYKFSEEETTEIKMF